MTTNAQDIVSSLDRINLNALGDAKEDRQQVIEAARRMLARLETPFERVWRWSWVSFNIFASCQTLMDIGLWEGWLEAGAQEVSLKELSGLCKVSGDVVLISRLMRLMLAEHIVEEVGPDRYKATPLSIALGKTTRPVAQTLMSGTHHGLPSSANLPSFLAANSYREPSDPLNTNYMDLTPERMGFWARCGSDPKLQASFIGYMEGLSRYKDDWTELYDTERLLDGFDKDGDGILLIDVGGAHGVDTMRFLDKHPNIPSGKLALQDLPEVIPLANVSDKVRPMAYDFFTPQPIKGARAYLFHQILHDWDDIDARRILKHVGAAMTKGYSKLLLCDVVVPPTGATIYQSMADISLMHLISAAERTEMRWRLLLESANFQIVKIWSRPFAAEAVIEAELI